MNHFNWTVSTSLGSYAQQVTQKCVTHCWCISDSNCHKSDITYTYEKNNPRPSRQSVNNLLHIFKWRHSSVVHHEQMGQCDCHVNDVLQSITWGTVVITARVLSPGRGLKVSYDLSWITRGPNNLLRLEDTPRCILNIPPVSPPEQRDREREGKKGGGNIFFTWLLLTFISLLWLMSRMPPVSPWSPISVSFCLLTNFISSDKTTVDKMWSLFKPFR